MLFETVPTRMGSEESTTNDNKQISTRVTAVVIVFVGILALAIAFYLRVKKRTTLEKQVKPPAAGKRPAGKPAVVQFDLPSRLTVEESIDFVVPTLQSPRTLKAGAGIFEVHSPCGEHVERSLYEPTARAYCPPSIGFTIEYDREHSRSLIVRLSGAKDLSPSKLGVNPIVKVTLYPDKIKHVSRLQKDTTRPVFGDVFQFDLAGDVSIDNRCLKFTLYDQDKLGKRVLGKAMFALKKTMHQSERWISLTFQQRPNDDYGEVTIQLEQNEAFFVCSLLSVRGVPKDTLVHVKLGVYVNHKPYRKCRSASFQALGGIMTLKERIELLKSDFSLNHLSTVQIIISLHSRKKMLAKCHVGPRSSVEGIEHWAEMLTRNKAVKAHRFLSV